MANVFYFANYIKLPESLKINTEIAAPCSAIAPQGSR